MSEEPFIPQLVVCWRCGGGAFGPTHETTPEFDPSPSKWLRGNMIRLRDKFRGPGKFSMSRFVESVTTVGDNCYCPVCRLSFCQPIFGGLAKGVKLRPYPEDEAEAIRAKWKLEHPEPTEAEIVQEPEPAVEPVKEESPAAEPTAPEQAAPEPGEESLSPSPSIAEAEPDPDPNQADSNPLDVAMDVAYSPGSKGGKIKNKNKIKNKK